MIHPKTFKSEYEQTIKRDSESHRHYIELPISDLNELAYMQTSLLEGISLLSQLEKQSYNNEQLQSAIYWLSKILLASYPHSELDGLSE